MNLQVSKKRLFRVNEAADYAAVSRAKLYQEMKLGNLKFLKLGASTRIEALDLDRWIDETSKKSAA